MKGWALMIGVQNGYRLKVAKLADQDVVPWKVSTRIMRIFVRFRFHFRHNSVTSGSFPLQEGAGVESFGTLVLFNIFDAVDDSIKHCLSLFWSTLTLTIKILAVFF